MRQLHACLLQHLCKQPWLMADQGAARAGLCASAHMVKAAKLIAMSGGFGGNISFGSTVKAPMRGSNMVKARQARSPVTTSLSFRPHLAWNKDR